MDEFERRSRYEMNKARKAIENHKQSQLSKKQQELTNWAKNNPVQASYDNDGNPVEH
jgi:hypothetical protein